MLRQFVPNIPQTAIDGGCEIFLQLCLLPAICGQDVRESPARGMEAAVGTVASGVSSFVRAVRKSTFGIRQ